MFVIGPRVDVAPRQGVDRVRHGAHLGAFQVRVPALALHNRALPAFRTPRGLAVLHLPPDAVTMSSRMAVPSALLGLRLAKESASGSDDIAANTSELVFDLVRCLLRSVRASSVRLARLRARPRSLAPTLGPKHMFWHMSGLISPDFDLCCAEARPDSTRKRATLARLGLNRGRIRRKLARIRPNLGHPEQRNDI